MPTLLSPRARHILLILTAVFALIAPQKSEAQIVTIPGENIDADSIKRAFADTHYYFGLYKDNYFIFGCPVDRKPTRENSNVKFQISIAQKLTKATLPWETYLYLFYTQKVFWNVLENSMPMTDLNFNPGIGLTKPMFLKSRYIGNLNMVVEHESNGRDGLASRSWNKVTFGADIMVDPNFVVSGKLWIPIVDGENNRDILKYCGIGRFGWQWRDKAQKLSVSVNLTARTDGFFNFNTCIEAAWRWSTRSNQYLFLQYYNGYGEGLLDYNVYHNQLRLGIVIKPVLFSEF